MPSSLESSAEWLEIGVLGSCPGPTQLAGGLPPTGMLDRIAVQKGDTSPPPIGTLKKGAYGFAAVARGNDCSVLGTGCTSADVTNARDVSISITPTQKPVGGCAPDQSCVDARCIAAPGPAGAGSGCAMSLVGAGPLGDPIDAFPDVVSAPAVAVTERGFLVAYREYDQSGGTAQLTVAAIDASGALSIPTPTMLPATCPMQDMSDAVGMAYVAGAGVIASARPACGAQSGIDLFAVDATGHSASNMFGSLPGPVPVLSNAHSLSLSGMSTGWLAYTSGGKANVVALSNLQVQGSPVPLAGGSPQTLAEVAATSQAVALLSGSGNGSAGGDAGGGGSPLLDLTIGSMPVDGGAPTAFAGTWGALAAAGTRALVLSDSGVQKSPVAWHALDEGGVPTTGMFAPPGMGPAIGGDLALQGDRAIFAVEQSGAISLAVFDHASTTPTPLRSVSLSGDARIPPQAQVRDGKLAVAASTNEVLVAWVTGTQLDVNETVGGWALYACSP